MKTLEIVFAVVLWVMAVPMIVVDVRLILLMKKTEKKAVVFSLYNILWEFFLLVGVTCSFIGGNISVTLYAAFCVFAFTMLPLIPIYITPQGMPKIGLKEASFEPADSVSYEYAQGGLFKETLMIYRNGSEVPIKLHFGINSPKLITILNDNYVKHGYENPLLKEQ